MFDMMQYLDAYKFFSFDQPHNVIGDPILLHVDLRLHGASDDKLSSSIQLDDFIFEPSIKGRVWIEQGFAGGQTMTLRLPPAHTPGIINAYFTQTQNKAAAIAVQLDPRESDFTAISNHQLQSLMQADSNILSNNEITLLDDWETLAIDYNSAPQDKQPNTITVATDNQTRQHISLLWAWLPVESDGSVSLWPFAIILTLLCIVLEQVILIVHRGSEYKSQNYITAPWRGGRV